MIDVEKLSLGMIDRGKVMEKQKARNTQKVYGVELSARYGEDIKGRIAKLKEEVQELSEVDEIREDFLDELCDVNAVLMHINDLLGLQHMECVERAFIKIRKRDTDPNYKRKPKE